MHPNKTLRHMHPSEQIAKQTDFPNKRDHISIVLENLYRKRINLNGGNLFSCLTSYDNVSDA